MVIHLFALLSFLSSLLSLVLARLLYLTLGEHVRRTIRTYRCPRLIEFFFSSLLLLCSVLARAKKANEKKKEEGTFSDR